MRKAGLEKRGGLTAVTQSPTCREQSSAYSASHLLAFPSLLLSPQIQPVSEEAEGPQPLQSPVLGSVCMVVWLLATPLQGP